MAPAAGASVAPPPKLWIFLEAPKKDRCFWKELAFGAWDAQASHELAAFPSSCEDADIAWAGANELLFLGGGKVFRVKPGAPPVALPVPDQQRPRAVGWDDVPLLFTMSTTSVAEDHRAFAWEGERWVEREHGTPGDPLEQLGAFQNQRGDSARKRRMPRGFGPVPASDALGLVADRTLEGDAARIAEGIADPNNRLAENAFVVPSAPSFGQLELDGERIALRGSAKHLLPDLFRYRRERGAWERVAMASPSVESLRRVIWPAGIELRGSWILLTSDGRGGALVHLKTEATKHWGMDVPLSLFAP